MDFNYLHGFRNKNPNPLIILLFVLSFSIDGIFSKNLIYSYPIIALTFTCDRFPKCSKIFLNQIY